MSSVSSIPWWVSLCGQVAPLASIVVFLAPWPTLRQIVSDKTVHSLPLLPYTSMVASTFLWTMYGILKNEPKIYSSNAIGLFLAIYYVALYIPYGPKLWTTPSTTLPGSIQQHMQGCATVIFVTLYFTWLGQVEWIGRLGVAFCLALFASPLVALRTVCQTKSATSIPWPFTLATTVNCGLWTVWGVFAMHDCNVYIPNSLGLLFALVQIALKVSYGTGKEPLKFYRPESSDLQLEENLLPK